MMLHCYHGRVQVQYFCDIGAVTARFLCDLTESLSWCFHVVPHVGLSIPTQFLM